MFKEGHVYRFQDEDYMQLYSTFDNSMAAIIGENFFEVLSTDANGNVLSIVVYHLDISPSTSFHRYQDTLRSHNL